MGGFRNDTERGESTAKRRSVLRALGGAGAVAALGSAGAAAAGTPAAARARARQDGEIDPVYGYPAQSGEEEPPVSPNVEVTLEIRPRDAPIPEFVFEPTGLYLEPGDTVRFSYESPHHTVTAYHPEFGYVPRVPEGVPPFSAPPLPVGGYWLYTFEQEGVYELHCAPHEIFGHAMRIVVGSPSGPAADPLPDVCETAGTATTEETEAETATAEGMDTETTEVETTPDEGGGEGEEEGPALPRFGAYTVLRDPALEPDNIVDERRVRWDDLDPESKRLFLRVEGFPPC
ncbi:hypothetical protein NGM10_07815 [Halorussus salilacus]|uniref:cupredoxin domain-containing protein n=1 Tax=Halorussus salilacus TaxID=2953750 RepID=UPI0020A1B03A|nr:hypothetical protein [Halorussus salilacus]USZ69625.1 hypothetical protein NGM10_07815 [Halorussus salilacus]